MEHRNESATLTPAEAHQIVGRDKISRASWYNGLRRNEIPNVRVGKRFLIPRHAFMRWLEGQ
jgi:excisionase family DNA binding protein